MDLTAEMVEFSAVVEFVANENLSSPIGVKSVTSMEQSSKVFPNETNAMLSLGNSGSVALNNLRTTFKANNKVFYIHLEE